MPYPSPTTQGPQRGSSKRPNLDRLRQIKATNKSKSVRPDVTALAIKKRLAR